MSLEETELKIGGVKLKGIWIALVLSIATTMAGGIWAVAEFYGRIEAVEEIVDTVVDSKEKLTKVGANLETIMENQKELLDMRDRIAEAEKTVAESKLIVEQAVSKIQGLDKISTEIDDLWKGIDAVANPLK
tara:strand:- start:53 stop:448 length:396 start_codon:yes stop_codon:yes gene_type:complete